MMKLVADIGGTHARFALLEANDALAQVQILKTKDYANLAAAIQAYWTMVDLTTSVRNAKEVSAVISIAAPLLGDRVKMTNASWDFSIAQTWTDLGLKSLQLINDFEALALAVPTLQTSELTAIGHNLPIDVTNVKAIMGPGTGLGMAGVMPVGQNEQITWYAIPCEGGHASFSPATDREAALLEAAWRLVDSSANSAHISWEDFLSGVGLPLLHRTVCAVDGLTYQLLTPAQISEAAFSHADAGCLATLHAFCELLGNAAGNLVLTMGARGGIYLKGGVLDSVLALAPDFLQKSKFRKCFEAKGNYAAYLQSIPTWFVTAPQIALRGCANLLNRNKRNAV